MTTITIQTKWGLEEFTDPAEYADEPLCPCCGGGGFPDCSVRDHNGDKVWTHEETCAIYQFGDLCTLCEQSILDEETAAATGVSQTTVDLSKPSKESEAAA